MQYPRQLLGTGITTVGDHVIERLEPFFALFQPGMGIFGLGAVRAGAGYASQMGG